MNRRALKSELDWLSDSRTFNLERDRATRLAAQHSGCFLISPAFRWLSGDLGDAIAWLEARALGRPTGKRGYHDQPTVADIYFDSQPGIVAGRTLVETGKAVRRKKCRVWIPELVEHPVN